MYGDPDELELIPVAPVEVLVIPCDARKLGGAKAERNPNEVKGDVCYKNSA